MENQITFFLYLSTFLFLFFIALLTWKNSKYKNLASILPPGPPKFPLIGNLHLLIGPQPHRSLAQLARKYGPVMLLQLGEIPTVVISSASTAKEVMKNHDFICSARPTLYAAESIAYNFQDIVFSHGDYWRQIRKICVLEMFSAKRVQSFRIVREEEVSNLVITISSKSGSIINLKDFSSRNQASAVLKDMLYLSVLSFVISFPMLHHHRCLSILLLSVPLLLGKLKPMLLHLPSHMILG